jgi:transposase
MTSSLKKFSAYVGLDWASKKHDVCIQTNDSHERKFKVIKHSPEAIDEWLTHLQSEVNGPIAIAVELSSGPIVYALQKYAFVTVFPIHAATLARYRQAMFPSGAKDDPSDAELALDLMLKYPEKIKPLQPSSEASRTLNLLVEQRRMLVEDKRRHVNRLINALKQYYPLPLTMFSHRGSDLFCEFLIRWPTFKQLKRARENTIRMFFRQRGGNAVTNTDKRIKAIETAMTLTEDSSIIEPYSLLVVSLCNQIQLLNKSIKAFDREVESVFKQMPDADIFSSLPGTGPCLAPRLLAAFGEDRSRFLTAQEIQNYAGLSPVTERSGNKEWIHWRWQCAKFIRQTFIEWSAKSVHQSYWAGLYYEKQRAKGKAHQAAVRALAFKWARIVFRCWQTRTPYNETKYLKALRERNSPLLNT